MVGAGGGDGPSATPYGSFPRPAIRSVIQCESSVAMVVGIARQEVPP